MGKLVFGVGVNDADYVTQQKINGKFVMCQFYQTWKAMLCRCYSAKFQSRCPTYIGCSVCDEWLTFSNFKRWMEKQDWQCKQLDKDLLASGNKVYSPESCAFVDSMTNKFATDSGAVRGDSPLGVYFSGREQKFLAQCCNPFTKKREHHGYFSCPDQAHQAWRKRKHELACQLADLQADGRVADALRLRYA